jgi:hypothetical protein
MSHGSRLTVLLWLYVFGASIRPSPDVQFSMNRVIPPKANGAFVAAMEDVLAVYTRPHDPDHPLVCLDETSKQLTADTRMPILMKVSRPARFDYEYERKGTANLFMMFAPFRVSRTLRAQTSCFSLASLTTSALSRV